MIVTEFLISAAITGTFVANSFPFSAVSLVISFFVVIFFCLGGCYSPKETDCPLFGVPKFEVEEV